MQEMPISITFSIYYDVDHQPRILTPVQSPMDGGYHE
jgi:hypothetical protein